MNRETPYRNIPHQSDLFLDYLDLSPKALSFYHHPPRYESLERAARELAPMDFPRAEIAAILADQNEAYGCTDRTRTFIEDLKKPGSVAVVTGQQVGLFTGPLYTVHKALTTIRLAEQLRARSINAVPIFWMDSEDHDLAEVLHVSVLGKDPSAPELDFHRQLFPDLPESERPAGSIEFPETIREVVARFSMLLPDSGRKDFVRQELEQTYKPGATFASSFGCLMTRLFRSRGLILFDPRDPAAKKLGSEVFKKTLLDTETIFEHLTERNKALNAAGYHTQVSVPENFTVFFLLENGQRRPLSRQDGSFTSKHGGNSFDKQALLEMAEGSPELLSPSVLLRPVLQDHLFPTVAYVGGPAEVAYFAQIEVLYRIFGRPMPVIWPRSSFTLLDSETAGRIERYAITLDDLFQGKHHVVGKILNASGHAGSTRSLEEIRRQIDLALNELEPAVATIDPSLGAGLQTAKRKILHNVEGLQAKFVHYEARRDRGVVDEAELLLNYAYPGKSLQERSVNVCSFLALYGPKVLDVLYSMVVPEEFVHRVVKLE